MSTALENVFNLYLSFAWPDRFRLPRSQINANELPLRATRRCLGLEAVVDILAINTALTPFGTLSTGWNSTGETLEVFLWI